MKTAPFPHPQIEEPQPVPALKSTHRVNNGLSNFESRLRSLYRVSSLVDLPVPVCVQPARKLKRGVVFSVNGSTKCRHLTVNAGVIWLTETPGNGDVLLSATDSHVLTGSGPAVIEALEDAEFVLSQD